MAANRVIAVVGLPTLVAVGLKSLLVPLHEIRISVYSTFEDFRNVEEGADGYVVSADIYVSNPDYFMPRRQKTLIYGDFHLGHGAESRQLISLHEDESEIGEKLAMLLDGIFSESVEQGELSVREKEVLRLLVAGKINKEIADELCISINTVITHRKNITSKTGIKSVSGLSIYALMNGIS